MPPLAPPGDKEKKSVAIKRDIIKDRSNVNLSVILLDLCYLSVSIGLRGWVAVERCPRRKRDI